MDQRWSASPHFDHYAVHEHVVACVSETQGVRTLVGAYLPLLSRLSERPLTLDELASELQALPRAPSRSDVGKMVSLLRSEGVVTPAGPSEETAGRADVETRAARIAVRTVGNASDAGVRDIFACAGLDARVCADASVVLTDDYMRPELERINAQHLQNGRPWLLAKAEGRTGWVGPLFAPGDGPCWRCYADRRRKRDESRRFIGRLVGSGDIVVPPLPATGASRLAVLGMIPSMLERAAEGDPRALATTIWTFDTATSRWHSHTLVRRPQCPACGAPESATPRAIRPLRTQAKLHSGDGGHRGVDPLVTFERYQHVVSPVTGIVDALEGSTGVHGLPYYWSTSGDAAVKRTWRDLLTVTPFASFGKGVQHVQARTSALAEAIERHCFCDNRPPDGIVASLRELGERAVDPRTVLLFSEQQRATRRKNAPFHERVPPRRFDPSERVGWTEAWSLTRHVARWIASDFCWMTMRTSEAVPFCYPDSNGCAVGNTLEEAILQGLLELIERDAVALWWYNRTCQHGVDLSCCGDAAIEQVTRHHREALGRKLWALDLTTDVDVPAFVALSGRAQHDHPEFVFSFGCHLDPRIALRRAVTEAAQIMSLQHPWLSRDDGENPWRTASRAIDPAIERWLRETRWRDHDYLQPTRSAPTRVLSDFADQSSPDLLDDIETCVRRLDALGIEALVVDATRPDIGMPAVRVVAPGLRHFWRQLGPGRLYDVPVALGRLSEPRREEQMNPTSIFL